MTFLELEKICKKRKRVKIIKLSGSIIVLIGVFLAISYLNINKKNFKPSVKTEKNLSNLGLTSKKITDENKTTKKIKKEIKKAEKIEPIINLNLSEIKSNSLTPKTKHTTDEKIKNKKTDITIKNKIDINNTKPAKNKIKKTNTLKTTKLPSFDTCIALSKKYYEEGNYKEALKWAKNANLLDRKKAISWIMSAKALYNLGKKEKALKILKIYYNYNKDKKIKELIDKWK